MSSVLKLYAGDPGAVATDAAALLQTLSGHAPQISGESDDGVKRISLADAVGIATLAATVATLVLTVPGAVNDALDLRDRTQQTQLIEQIDAFQTSLNDAGTEATLDLGDGRTIDLRRAPVDDIVDALARKPAD